MGNSVTHSARVAANHRFSIQIRFEKDDAEALDVAISQLSIGHDKEIGARQQRVLFGLAYAASEKDMVHQI